MTFIRAHFDGRVVVPEEPVGLKPHSRVMVLIDAEPGVAEAALELATRDYYQQQSGDERSEDESWGRVTAADGGRAGK